MSRQSVVGIWETLRKKPDTEEITCSLCYAKVKDFQTYSERTAGEPMVICALCLDNMIVCKLDFLKEGG